MKFLLLYLVLCIPYSMMVYSQSTPVTSYNDSLVYINDPNKLVASADGEIYRDTPYRFDMPYKPIKRIYGAFLNSVVLPRKQIIIAINKRIDIDTVPFEFYELSFNEFEKIIVEKNLYESIPRFLKFKKRRLFGIRKIAGISLYVMYLNVKEKEKRKFEKSLKSFQLL